MAREFPIHNGRMTTDLDANGHKIKNLPPGSGFTQVQSDWGQTDTTAPDFIKNKPTIPVVPTLAAVATSGSYNDLSDKPTIPAPVDISGKLDGAAAYPAWLQDDYQPPAIVSHKGRLWRCQNYTISEPGEGQQSDWLEVTIEDLKQDALSSEQMDAVNSGATSAKVATWDGYAAQIAHKANATDLFYALVTPGEWEFSGVPDGVSNYSLVWDDGWFFAYYYEGESYGDSIPGDEDALELSFILFDSTITATRPSLPGHLCDRAVNAVSVSADTELTLPALVNAGKARDFLVRLAISGSTVPTITFAAPTGETLTYETDGDEFPVPDAEGTWLYSFTETAAHTFAVALKSVSVVTQGGV